MFTLKVIKITVSILNIRELPSKSSAFHRLIMPIMTELIVNWFVYARQGSGTTVLRRFIIEISRC